MEHRKSRYRYITLKNIKVLRDGIRDGIPIGLGYLAVSFSLGIAAKNAGLTVFQSFLASFLCTASAGEYAGFVLIAANATYLEVAAVTFITNIRYSLMSCAMSQRIMPGTPFKHRFLMGNYIVDEIFGIAISRPGYLNPYYIYGAVLVAIPCWSVGTALGTLAGNLLPVNVVSALSVALFGMFLAVIIPPAKKNKIIAGLIGVSFAASFICRYLPVLSKLSDGTQMIILTVAISAGAAVLFPKDMEERGRK